MSLHSRAAGPAAAICLVCASHPAFSATPDAELHEVVVTATRLQQPLRETIASVTVITREDIRRRQARSVQELLAGETGFGLVNSGGYGKLSTMHVRGTEPDHVLVLVDGVRLGSATAGTTRIEFIPVDQIERIEIVRGPRSSLYGPDAIGGVVHIFTTRGAAPEFALGGGSHSTYDATASIGHRGERGWFSVAANRFQSRGYDSCRASFAGGCFADEPDDDGFRNTSGSVRAGYAWNEFADIEASALYASGITEYDGTFTNETEFTEQVVALRARVRPSADWTLTTALGVGEDQADDLLDGSFVSRFDTRRRNASVQSDWALAERQILSLGVDYFQDRVDSTTPYEESSRDNTGVFAQYQARVGAHAALAAVRHDDNEQFGSHTTGNLGWKWTLSESLALNASWGTAFMAPNFNDLYFPGFSNPELDPEESTSYELGLEGGAGALRWSVAAFQTDADDLIVFDSAALLPRNLRKARIRGVEAELRTQLERWSIALGYTGLDPRDLSAGETQDNFLPRRARHSARVDLGYSLGNAYIGAVAGISGARYEDLGNSVRLGGYAVLDLVGEYSFGDGWSVQAKVANALDRDYETIAFYRQDGRNYFVTLRYQPGG